MKQEPLFKYLAAALVAAVILAFALPSPATTKPVRNRAITATTPHPVSAKS